MNRRLWLHALTTIMVCTWLPGAAFAAARPPFAAPLQSTLQESAEPGVPETAPDPLYAQAVAVVVTNKKASISLVQRLLKIGYNRAARLVDAMEQAGLISYFDVNGRRHILESGYSSVYLRHSVPRIV
jgi:DNA segregation ATPase FtsK/SpoIIIE-like protein